MPTPLLPLLTFLIDKLILVGNVLAKVLRPAIDLIVKVLLAASAQMMHFYASILDGVTKIPMLGKYLGVAGDGAKYLRDQPRCAPER